MPSITSVIAGSVPLPLDLVATAAGQLLGASPARTAAAGAGAARKATTATARTTTTAARKAATTTTKKASTTTTKQAGYATRLPADYAFLQDPKLSIEEKLSRFIGALMTKSEQDLLAQMEKMAPGSTPAGAAAAAAKPKSTKVSLWGLAKKLLPPLNLASQLVGEAKLKSLVTQVSGPVLAAAATAVGLPMLAPLATRYGPSLVGALTKDISVDLAALVGGDTAGGASSASGSSGSASPAAGASTAKPAAGSTSEKAQLMELQRLQDRDKELFSLFSNMLKSMHDSRMTCIQNIR